MAGGTIARTGGDATWIATITDLNIGIQEPTIIHRDMIAIMAGISIIAMITGGIVGTTAGNGVRRRGLNSSFDMGACPGVPGVIERRGLAPASTSSTDYAGLLTIAVLH